MFELKMKNKEKLRYLPTTSSDAVISTRNNTNGEKVVEISTSQESDPTTQVGIFALKDFGKFQVVQDRD